jgi:aldehyde:ferredoxin oxidoreductase
LPEKYDPHSVEGKAEFIAKFQDIMALLDSLTGCKFILFGLGVDSAEVILDWLNMATGWDMSMEEFMDAGARIVTLKRMYNIGHGQSRKDDVLPGRTMTHRRGEGGAADNVPHIGYMLSEYYDYRNWDEFGIPTEEALRKYGLI